jgi:hypothetical protein
MSAIKHTVTPHGDQPTEDDPSGILVWSREAYQLSSSQITHSDYRLRYTMQISALYAWVRQWGLQRYVFSGGGSGCRFWV